MSIALTGKYLTAAARRTVSTEDIGGGKVSQQKRFDIVTGLQIDRVISVKKADRTGEQCITLGGMYAPGKALRITGFSQHCDTIRESLKENVNADGSLKASITVNVVGEPMRGFGLLVHELEVVNPDGSKQLLIGTSKESVETEKVLL